MVSGASKFGAAGRRIYSGMERIKETHLIVAIAILQAAFVFMFIKVLDAIIHFGS